MAYPNRLVSDADRLAIAARLHVLLRRETGRIVDTEWLAENEEYASEIMRIAREHARRSGHQDMQRCADELAYALAHTAPKQPRTLFERVAWSIRQKDDGVGRGG